MLLNANFIQFFSYRTLHTLRLISNPFFSKIDRAPYKPVRVKYGSGGALLNR